MDKIEIFKQEIIDSKKIVFFGGAGVSTASGIPDFRSSKGIYNQDLGYSVTGEEILSTDFFKSNPKEFFDFSFSKIYFPDVKSSATHLFISELENKWNKDVSIVTQNIDGLHQKAGSTKVYEVHGTQASATCSKCFEKYLGKELLQMRDKDGILRCRKCKTGIVRHDVVLFGQSLPQEAVYKSIAAIEKADMLIVAGTSLNVYPAAGFIRYFKGKYLVVLNMESLAISKNSNDLVFVGDMNKVFEELRKYK